MESILMSHTHPLGAKPKSLIAAILDDIKTALAAAEMRQSDSLQSLIERSALEDLLKRAQSLLPKLAQNNFKIVLMGPPGVGKTTLINQALDFVIPKAKPTKSNLFVQVMPTAAGKTTLGTVRCRRGSKLHVSITPLSYDEQIEMLRDLAEFYFKKAHGLDEQSSLSTEHKRALEAQIGLVPDPEADQNLLSDPPVVALAKAYLPSQLEDFTNNIINLANLDARTQTEFSIEANDYRELSQLIIDLNGGKHPNAMLPEELTVEIPSELWAFGVESPITEIIDTRGISGKDINRQDLEDYFRDKDDCICVLMDLFTQVPGTASHALIDRFFPNNRFIPSKVALLVNYKLGEPEQTPGLSDDSDEKAGIVLRQREVIDTLTGTGFKMDNLLFRNVLGSYQPNKRDWKPISGNTPDDLQTQRENLRADLELTVSNYKLSLQEEAETIARQLADLKEGLTLNEVDNRAIRNTREQIRNLQRLFLHTAHFSDCMVEPWRYDRHVMQLHAFNRRYGHYKGYTIASDGKGAAEVILRDETTAHFKALCAYLEELNEMIDNTHLERILTQFLDSLESAFSDYYIGAGSDLYEWFDEVVFEPYKNKEFWDRCISRFGHGAGYRDEIFVFYAAHLDDFSCEDKLNNLANTHWSTLLQKAIHFLGGEL